MKFLHNTGLYIHIPFCRRKCAYCDFYSLIPSKKLISEYLSALSADIEDNGGLFDRRFDTVYLGGGTPSLLEDKISDVINDIKSNFNITDDAEITCEVNPDVSDVFLSSAKKSGVNRISIGIQSGNNRELQALGRTHTREDAENAVKRIKNAGFTNISADLMISLPDSDIGSLKENLDFFISLDIPHISSYLLKIEPNTKFYKFTPALPDEDDAADQYLFMCKYLEQNGYSHYEISNFAKSGYESRHNLKYWQCGEYLGLGPSAHSFIEGKRFFYERDIKKYIGNRQTVFDSYGGGKDERLMLGLRLKSGIKLPDNLGKNQKDRLNLLSDSGLININNENLSLTDKGMLLSNAVICEIEEMLL